MTERITKLLMPAIHLPFTRDTARIEVGAEPVVFVVHVDLLCAQTPYFSKTLHDESSKSDEKVIRLPDDEPETVRSIPELGLRPHRPRWSPTISVCGVSQFYKLWILADKVQISTLKNSAMEGITSTYAQGCAVGSPSLVNLVYGKTLPRSPLRKALAFHTAAVMSEAFYSEQKSNFSSEFMEDLCQTFITLRSSIEPQVWVPSAKNTLVNARMYDFGRQWVTAMLALNRLNTWTPLASITYGAHGMKEHVMSNTNHLWKWTHLGSSQHLEELRLADYIDNCKGPEQASADKENGDLGKA
ncbi:hypothetical protein EJ08DRAFT_699224 [Tothia fuscella]|uniref:BTB domain-containing protein n=1 Tax=Tothia fuscella TaxID=1048955 RepID=A0A9P4NMM4_9PEZI|nr:hypothetical protein EJ08DRAFT_699224 [Tothia fuscella]